MQLAQHAFGARYRISRRDCGGWSLIEVLVSVVILTIGLLGLAGMQTRAMLGGHSALLRSIALERASEIADRAMANPSVDYTTVSAAAVANCTSNAGCTPTQMAQNDLYEWSASLVGLLPASSGSGGIVCRDSTPNDGISASTTGCDGTGSGLVVKIWWQADQKAEGDAAKLDRVALSFPFPSTSVSD